MPVKQVRKFLDDNNVKYVTIIHSEAFTAQEIAQTAHIPGHQLAKTVVISFNNSMAMAVLPATDKVDFDLLSTATGMPTEIASESQFKDKFPGCEVGAMPPFGNLFNMDVFVSEQLTDNDMIAFNAGNHTEIIKMSYVDFARLVNPKVVELTL